MASNNVDIAFANYFEMTSEDENYFILNEGTAVYRRIGGRTLEFLETLGPGSGVGSAGSNPGGSNPGMGIPLTPVSFNYMLGTPLRKWKAVWAETPLIQTSDAKDKHHVADSELGLDFVMSLRPVSFRLKVDPKGGRHYGFIGQEMKKALKGRSFAGLVDTEAGMGVMYSELISPLVKALQEQQAQIDDLKEQVRKLRG